ncbi:anoctamin-9-like isoform X12 [Mobula birostris]|uniref:anoctamin-9-like isoform X12 n=1 Tax=Mobula birostris TaxID=1983395 RepID=UPI003B27F3CB
MLSDEGHCLEEGLEQSSPERPGTSLQPALRTQFKFRVKRGTAAAFRKARRLNKIAQQKVETIKRRAKEKNTVNVHIFHVTDNEEDYLMPEDANALVKVEFVLVTRKCDVGIGKSELDRRLYLNRLREIGLNIMKKTGEFDIFFGIQAPEKLFEKYIHLLDISERTCSNTGLDTVSKSTRIRIINFILRNTSIPGIGGLRELLRNKSFHSAFPLHEANIWKKEHILQNQWANWKSIFTKQPINHIRLYFGERLALYYAWLGWYTMMLIPAAVCGTVVFVYGLITFGNNQVSKEICDAHTTIMCPQCDQRCSFWRLSDTCAYSKVNYVVARKLCKLENQRTMLAKENSFTVKMFTFQFFNIFASIIYTAFFLGKTNGYPGNYVRIGRDWRLEECHPSGCIMDLFLQMSVIMVLKQILGTIMEYAVPYLQYKWKHRKRYLDDNVEDVPKHWIRNYNLNDFDSYSVFNEFLEMTIQYGFTTIFVAAFPLAPLLAFLNNIFEIRLDARKMIWHFKRPIPRKAKDIGIWLKILEVIGVLAVIGNGLVISLTSDFIPRQVYLYKYGPCKDHSPHKIDCMTGYVNNSLSVVHMMDFERTIQPSGDATKLLGHSVTYCRYRDYRNEYTQEPTVQYWHILAARLAFLVLFENIAVCVKYIAAWYISDVPVSIQNENLQRTYEQLKEELKMMPVKSAESSMGHVQYHQMIT